MVSCYMGSSNSNWHRDQKAHCHQNPLCEHFVTQILRNNLHPKCWSENTGYRDAIHGFSFLYAVVFCPWVLLGQELKWMLSSYSLINWMLYLFPETPTQLFSCNDLIFKFWLYFCPSYFSESTLMRKVLLKTRHFSMPSLGPWLFKWFWGQRHQNFILVSEVFKLTAKLQVPKKRTGEFGLFAPLVKAFGGGRKEKCLSIASIYWRSW